MRATSPGPERGTTTWWPFGKTHAEPHRENLPRTQCVPCAGGGEVNGCPCPGGCDGRGYFDANNKPPKTGK